MTEDDGGLVVVTHARTLGCRELEIAGALETAAAKLAREEEKALQSLVEHWGVQLQDAVARSVAVLGSARLLSRRELSSRLRWIALGARLGWIPRVLAETALEIFLSTGPRRLARLAGSSPSEFDAHLDDLRAQESVRIFRAIEPETA